MSMFSRWLVAYVYTVKMLSPPLMYANKMMAEKDWERQRPPPHLECEVKVAIVGLLISGSFCGRF